jgi:hypothetical protein
MRGESKGGNFSPPFGKGRWGGILKSLLQTANLLRKFVYQTRGNHRLLGEKSSLMPSFFLAVVIPAQEIVDPGRGLIQGPIAGGSISLF